MILVKIIEPELTSHHKKGDFLIWQDFDHLKHGEG